MGLAPDLVGLLQASEASGEGGGDVCVLYLGQRVLNSRKMLDVLPKSLIFALNAMQQVRDIAWPIIGAQEVVVE